MNCIPSTPIYSEPIAEPLGGADEESASSLAPRRLRLDPAHIAYARSARQALLEAFGADTSAPERLLIDLVAAELPVHGTLVEAEAQLSARLELLLLHDDIKSVSVLAKALRNVSLVTHAVGRRVETVLSTAVALRAQRRLVELHRGGTDR